MKVMQKILIMSLTLVFASACDSEKMTADAEGNGVTASSPSPKAQEVPRYDQNSWKQMIPNDCAAFFDGCNQCRRAPDSKMAACTKKMCREYQKPRCLDDEQASMSDATSEVKATLASQMGKGPRAFEYRCADASFKVFFNEYIADDQRMKLNSDQVMLSDRQTRTTSLLTRVESASGIKFSDGKITFWEKGEDAMVMIDDEPKYTDCKKLAITL